MAGEITVYKALIIKLDENGPDEMVIAHSSSGRPNIKNVTSFRNVPVIPFNNIAEAHQFCKEISPGSWIEKKGEIAHIPNGKILPWDGSL